MGVEERRLRAIAWIGIGAEIVIGGGATAVAVGWALGAHKPHLAVLSVVVFVVVAVAHRLRRPPERPFG